jgi:hypothetical protein
MLRHFKLDSRVKDQVHHDLPRLLRGEIDLARYALSPAQLEALQSALKPT